MCVASGLTSFWLPRATQRCRLSIRRPTRLAEKYRKDPETFPVSPHLGDEPDSARVFFGDKNLSLPRKEEQGPVTDSPWNAPPPKIDFSRPHTAGGKWQSSGSQRPKQRLNSRAGTSTCVTTMLMISTSPKDTLL